MERRHSEVKRQRLCRNGRRELIFRVKCGFDPRTKKAGGWCRIQPPARCLMSESFFENTKCHIPEKEFRFAPDATPAHDSCRVTLCVFVSDLSAVIVSADDQLTLASGFIGDIEPEDSAIDFEIHFFVWESVVESPTSYRVESVLGVAAFFDS